MNTTPKVVIVDPDPSDCLAMFRDRAGVGFQLHVLSSGRGALRFASTVPGALWLVNTRLPDMSGLELYHMLRPRLSGAAVLMVSDEYSVQEELQVCSLGNTTYLAKPLDMLSVDDLVAASGQSATQCTQSQEERRMVA